MLSTNTLTRCAGLLIVGVLSACSSSDDTTTPGNAQETVAADSTSNDGLSVQVESVQPGSPESDPVESDPVESNPVESEVGDTAESVSQDPQNDGQQLNTDSQQASVNTQAEGSSSEQSTAGNQRVNFGTAELLVDLTPNGDSYPAKFHRIGDKLYFWTVDTDPGFARCAYHWSNLSDDDKSVSFNLVATHPETGAVTMNKQIMTLGDFAENANSACAGYNGSIMQVFEQTWITDSATGEQQFILHFDSITLGPDLVWMTDGGEANTSPLETGQVEERLIFEGNKFFFVTADGLSVSNTLTGDRRKLYESDSNWFYGKIQHIVRSPARQATFEITVGKNRTQIWTYDLDTDEWVKKFSIKPDSNMYVHNETLLVDGHTLLSTGENVIDRESALGLSSTLGDVTSFEIASDSAASIYRASGDSIDQLAFSTTDFSADPETTSVWRYDENSIEKLFTVAEAGLENRRVIAGHDGRIYVTGTKRVRPWPDYKISLELWSYDTQIGQLVKLSNDDWYADIFGHPTIDEGYVFRYLNTPDGLVFVNLKEDSGRELWFTDGTREGTRQLADINPGTGNSDPRNFYYSGDAIYFSANDGTHGREPWMIKISR